VLATIVLLAAAFGTVEVTVVAGAEQLGSRSLAGPLLALWAFGSMAGGLAFGSRASTRGPEQRMIGLLLLVVAGLALLAVAAGVVQLAAGMVLAGLGIAPAIACLYLLVDRLAPAGTVTEAFTWVTTAFSTGFAIGNALGGSLVHRVGTDRSFLIAAAGIAAAALLARVRRPVLAVAPAGMREATEGLGRTG
jgi:MFS family permease